MDSAVTMNASCSYLGVAAPSKWYEPAKKIGITTGI